jgi:hypothetical protein
VAPSGHGVVLVHQCSSGAWSLVSLEAPATAGASLVVLCAAGLALGLEGGALVVAEHAEAAMSKQT